MNAKRLIVNADDFGLSEGINRGISYCFQNGIVTSATVIPTGVAFDHAVGLAKQNPALDIGVHLTLIAEEPVLPSDEVKSLVDKDGCFFDSHITFIWRYLAGKIDLREVASELEAQIDKTIKADIPVTHIDSHRHLHMLPAILETVVSLAKKFNIRGIRVPDGNGWRFFDPKELGLQVLRRQSKKKLIGTGLSFTEHFWGLKEGGKITERDLLDLLDDLSPGVTEIMCHPGYIDEVYRERYANWGYLPETEVAALTSEAVKVKLKAMQVGLINFKDLSSERSES